MNEIIIKTPLILGNTRFDETMPCPQDHVRWTMIYASQKACRPFLQRVDQRDSMDLGEELSSQTSLIFSLNPRSTPF